MDWVDLYDLSGDIGILLVSEVGKQESRGYLGYVNVRYLAKNDTNFSMIAHLKLIMVMIPPKKKKSNIFV